MIPKQHGRGFWISDPSRTEERIQNFWSPKQHRRGFRISDPQTTQERIQDFWPPNNTGDSEFLTLKQHRKGFRISDPPNNTGVRIQNFWFPNNTGDLEFLIPQTTQERIQNFWFPKQQRRGYRIFNPLVNKNTIQEGFQYFRTPVFFSGLKAVKCLEFEGWSQHMILEQCKDWLFHNINFIQSLVLHPINAATLKFIIEGFSSCCPPERCLSDHFFCSW